MADILTQLQTCLDQVSYLVPPSHQQHNQPAVSNIRIQLATQFYATLCYLTTYNDHSSAIPPPNIPTAIHQLSKIEKNPPPTGGGGGGGAQASATPEEPAPPRPDSPTTFSHRQRELARDLIIKEQQIEYLISVLPGIGSSEAEQEARIKELEGEVRAVEEERREKRKELKALRVRLDEALGAVGRGIGTVGAGAHGQAQGNGS